LQHNTASEVATATLVRAGGNLSLVMFLDTVVPSARAPMVDRNKAANVIATIGIARMNGLLRQPPPQH